MKKNIQLNLFLTALMFYTRLPGPKWIEHREEYLNRSTVYLPVIGWLVGGICSLVFWSLSFILPIAIAVFLSMIAGVLVTGAFHEDGFADVCDGFGGGWTKQRILEIMKDSRVGVYGVIGIMLLLGLKFLTLVSVDLILLPWVILIAHSLSRTVALSFIYTHDYARESEDSKVKPVAQKMNLSSFLLSIFWGLLPLLLLSYWYESPLFLLLIIPLILLQYFLGRYFQKWINGYTGDCLGAAQQLAEVIVYLFFSSTLWISI